tara:strand:- start:1031 stop:1147 length:117 start_codon:yes stop_codon:yes gene_type:complete
VVRKAGQTAVLAMLDGGLSSMEIQLKSTSAFSVIDEDQ